MALLESLLERLFPPASEPVATLRQHVGKRVVVRGTVVPRDLITSPLSGEPCVYYRYLIEAWLPESIPLGLGSAGGQWVASGSDEAICEFYVEDDTGRALVAVEESRVEVLHAGAGDPVEVPQGRRASEIRLAAGDRVEIHGAAGEIADTLDEARGYRDDVTRGLVRAVDDGMLRIRLTSR